VTEGAGLTPNLAAVPPPNGHHRSDRAHPERYGGCGSLQVGDAPHWNIGRGRPILSSWTTHRTTVTRPAGSRRRRARPNSLPPSPGAKPSLPPGRSCPVTKCCANWTRALPAWRRSVRGGDLEGPPPVVDRADARGHAACPGAVCVLRGTRSAGGGACPTERSHRRMGENRHFAGGWPAGATALPAACPTGQGMAQVRALLDWLPNPTHYRHRRRLFRDGEHPRPRVARLGRPSRTEPGRYPENQRVAADEGGPPRNWGSSGNRGWRGYVVCWIKLLSEVETERAIVDGATNLKQEVRAAW
jgi:hypothetical protein